MSETTSNILAQDSLSRKSLAFCGYTGYAAIILFIIGGVWLGGMLPPIPNANDAPAELVAKVNDNLLNFRVGSIFMIASFALFEELAGSSRAEIIAPANASEFLTGTSFPVTPSSIFSGIAPPLEATTGSVAAIASTTERPKLSIREGKTPRLLCAERF